MKENTDDFDIDLFVDNFIESKINKNINYIEISYNELVRSYKLQEKYIENFIRLAKRDLEADWYSVYKSGATFIYNNKEQIVPNDIILIAIRR